jgi:gluconate 2-dehydrogenase gamma chain
MRLSRRCFCQELVYVGFGSYLALATGACRRRPREASPSPAEDPAFCTAAEYLTLAAACERLFPRDDDPGAIDLDAPRYVDRQLVSDDFSGWQESFRTHLADLDTDAQSQHQHAFAQLSPAEQDALIAGWADGPRERQTFVRRLMQLTLEGVFGDPSYGGNRDGKGWALVGFEPSEPRPGEHHHLMRKTQ